MDRSILTGFGWWRVVFVGLALLAYTLWAFFWMKSHGPACPHACSQRHHDWSFTRLSHRDFDNSSPTHHWALMVAQDRKQKGCSKSRNGVSCSMRASILT
jgi:hypothetical protein